MHRYPGLSNPLFVIEPEVGTALYGGKPVVALESALITHGLTFSQNLRSLIRGLLFSELTLVVLRKDLRRLFGKRVQCRPPLHC